VERKAVRKMGLILAILLAILFYILSPYLINGLFPKYSSAIPAAQIIAFGVIPLSISSILNSKILGRAKNTRPVLLGAGAYVISLFLSMYFLGKIFGLEGLAIGVVLSISLQSLTLWICSIIQNKTLSIDQ
jgi:O-antigen/teichoic acid export membrane protein